MTFFTVYSCVEYNIHNLLFMFSVYENRTSWTGLDSVTYIYTPMCFTVFYEYGRINEYPERINSVIHRLMS